MKQLQRHIQRDGVAHPYPLWLRLLTLACLLLVVGASMEDAVHIHGEWLPHHEMRATSAAAGSQLPGPDNCPLCVAMHSALPVVARLEAVRMDLVQCRLAQGVDRAPETNWHFASFSRPPPAMTL
jgi:hypothetical protein